MVTASEKIHLKKLLQMSEDPDSTLSYDELLGYMFGLAITPDMLVPSEWMPIIFGGELPEFTSMKQMQTMTKTLIQVYNNFVGEFHDGTLVFPYNMDSITEKQLPLLYEWVSGFEEAIALRDELWDPEEFPELSERKAEELYQSMMTIQGLVDPVEAMEFFEDMPEELFQEVFPDNDSGLTNREAQIQCFLLSSLPFAVETLLSHAQDVEKKRQQHMTRRSIPSQIRSTKVGRNDPCPCNSGKKYKKCCGGASDQQVFSPTDLAPKKSNVIKVDFPQHGKKRSKAPAPVYQLKVGLKGAKPPIWRRVLVPGDFTLEQLHETIQICMEWENLHLHMFIIDKTMYSPPEDDNSFLPDNQRIESKYTLHDLEKKIQPKFRYVYDFGDDWIHEITVEKILPAEENQDYPVLLTGRKASPLEDMGGMHRYQHFLEVSADPGHEEYQEMADWIDLDLFDPSQFDKQDIEELNGLLRNHFHG